MVSEQYSPSGSPFEILHYPHGHLCVFSLRSMCKLTYDSNRISNIRLHMGQINQLSNKYLVLFSINWCTPFNHLELMIRHHQSFTAFVVYHANINQ